MPISSGSGGKFHITLGESSELMRDFAQRAGEALGCTEELKAAADAELKAEFAGEANENDCRAAAVCALALQKIAREKLTGFSRFKYITLRKLV